ncbi:MAG: DUF2007 domain-containing protein [Polyangiaceae bacterium]
MVALLAAWAMDVVAGHLGRRGRTDLVTVWTEERPFAAVAAQAALRHRGIEAVLVGLCQRSLLQLGAGYAPVEVLVPEKDAPRAHTILRRALPDPAGGEASENESEAREKKKKKKPLDAVLAPVARASVAVGVIAAVLVGLVVVREATRPPPPGPLTAAQREERAKVLHPAGRGRHAGPSRRGRRPRIFRKGVAELRHCAPRSGKTAPALRYVRRPGRRETTGARWRLVALSHGSTVFRCRRARDFALQEVTETDPDTGAPVVTGLRTYLVKGEPLLTGADVEDAMAAPGNRDRNEGWMVRVQLTPEGGERFQRATARTSSDDWRSSCGVACCRRR